VSTDDMWDSVMLGEIHRCNADTVAGGALVHSGPCPIHGARPKDLAIPGLYDDADSLLRDTEHYALWRGRVDIDAEWPRIRDRVHLADYLQAHPPKETP
jgi:hypothetical protein